MVNYQLGKIYKILDLETKNTLRYGCMLSAGISSSA